MEKISGKIFEVPIPITNIPILADQTPGINKTINNPIRDKIVDKRKKRFILTNLNEIAPTKRPSICAEKKILIAKEALSNVRLCTPCSKFAMFVFIPTSDPTTTNIPKTSNKTLRFFNNEKQEPKEAVLSIDIDSLIVVKDSHEIVIIVT